MIKRISIVIMSMAAMLLFSACQATPEAPVVAGKSSDELIEKARTAAGEGDLAERLGAPERYQGIVSSVDGKLNVTIDATVAVPEADSAARYILPKIYMMSSKGSRAESSVTVSPTV